MDADCARVWFEQAGDTSDQGRLACAVVSEERNDLAGVHRKADAVESGVVAEALRDITDFQRRARGSDVGGHAAPACSMRLADPQTALDLGAQAVKSDRSDQNRADRERRPVRRYRQERQTVRDRSQDHRPDDGRPDASAPAGKARAADDDGSDREQNRGAAVDGPGVVPARDENAGHRREQAGYQVDTEEHAPDRDADLARGDRVTADADDPAAPDNALQEDGQQRGGRDHEKDRTRDPENRAVRQRQHVMRNAGDLGSARFDVGEALDDVQHPQRDDEGVPDPQRHDHERVDGADCGADAERRRHREPGRTRVVAEDDRYDDRAQPDSGAKRDVERADQNHQQRSEREESDRARLDEDVLEIRGCQEVRTQQREQGPDKGEDDHRPGRDQTQRHREHDALARNPLGSRPTSHLVRAPTNFGERFPRAAPFRGRGGSLISRLALHRNNCSLDHGQVPIPYLLARRGAPPKGAAFERTYGHVSILSRARRKKISSLSPDT